MKMFILMVVCLLPACASNPVEETQKQAEAIGTRIVREVQTTVSDLTTVPATRTTGSVSVVINGQRRVVLADVGKVIKTPEIRTIPLPK